ncbi:hypothetical protein D3C84_711170 [compost metagenome]
MPQRALDPGHARDKTVGLQGAQDFPGFGVDLMNFPFAVLAHPQRAFGPGQARVVATAGGRNGGEDFASAWVDFLDAVLGDLEQVRAIECRAGMAGDIERAQQVATVGVQGVELVGGCKPHLLTVPGNAVHGIDIGKGAIFTQDFGG